LRIKRTLGAHPRYWYFLRNAPVSVPLRLLVWLSGVRWAIAQCFEETKTELGMDHYEVRKYPGWHHHLLTCMLAHFFLWHLQIRVCPTFYTWCFSLGCAAHDANHDARPPCCNAHPRLLR